MDFYGRLAGADFGGNVLVEHAGDYEGHHLPLSRGQCLITLVQRVDLGLVLSRSVVPMKRLLDRVEQILIPKRFRQELHGPRLQRPDRHRNVSMSRNEDDRDLQTDLGQSVLEIKTAHLRQSYIEDQATGIRRALLS